MPPNPEGTSPDSDNPLDVIQQASGVTPETVAPINDPAPESAGSPLISPVEKLVHKMNQSAAEKVPGPPAPDPDQPQSRADLCQRAALNFETGPGHYHGWRDQRP